MQEKIHPRYELCDVSCACGTHFQTRSTASAIHVDVCSNCHPFYSGRQKLATAGGRIDRFERRRARGLRSGHKTSAA